MSGWIPKESFALKGQNNVPRNGPILGKGTDPLEVVWPFQGEGLLGDRANPGRCPGLSCLALSGRGLAGGPGQPRALPWAKLFWPFQGEGFLGVLSLSLREMADHAEIPFARANLDQCRSH